MDSGKPKYTAELLSARNDESSRLTRLEPYSDDLIRCQVSFRYRLAPGTRSNRGRARR